MRLRRRAPAWARSSSSPLDGDTYGGYTPPMRFWEWLERVLRRRRVAW